MKILYVGYIVPKSIVNNTSGLSEAGNRYQIELIEALSKINNIQIDIVSIYPNASFNKGPMFQKQMNIFESNLEFNFIKYVNFPIFKLMSIFFNMKRIIKKKLRFIQYDFIISFNAYPLTFIPITRVIKKKNINHAVILADLPYSSFNKIRFIRYFINHIYEKLTWKAIKEIHHLIVLNDNALKYANQSVRFLKIEGGIRANVIQNYRIYDKKVKKFIYTGSLDEYSGILEFVSVFKDLLKTHDDIELDIYGFGYYEKDIAKIAVNSSFINFYGKVENSKINLIQQNAYVLVNPREVDHKISEVTFPSKIFEYFASGRPVLSTNLNALKEDYKDFYFEINTLNKEEYAKSILSFLTLEEADIELKVNKTMEFLKKEKIWSQQAKRLAEFINNNLRKPENE